MDQLEQFTQKFSLSSLVVGETVSHHIVVMVIGSFPIDSQTNYFPLDATYSRHDAYRNSHPAKINR